MIVSYIALTLSVINSILWIVFAVGIRKLFNKLMPLFISMGLIGAQNLTAYSNYAKIREPAELSDAESEQ